MRVLVVEDERKVAEALQEGLQAEAYDVVVERTGEAAFARIAAEVFDVVLLDLGLPGLSGLDVLRAVRELRITVPVLVLTARDAVEDRVTGLDAGADDYLIKPFAFDELLGRIRALLRRGQVCDDQLLMTLGPLSLDIKSRTVTRDGEVLDLTRREFAVLEHLLRHQREVVPREALARDVWREPRRTTPLDNVIDVHIARLRRKVDGRGGPKLIHTIRGVGFMLAEGEP